MVRDAEEFEDHIEGNVYVHDAFVLLESRGNPTGLVLVDDGHLIRMLKSIAILAQHEAFYCLVLYYVLDLQLVELYALCEVKRPLDSLYNEVASEIQRVFLKQNSFFN